MADFLSRLVKGVKKRERDPLTPLIDEYLATRDRSPNRLQRYTVRIPQRLRPKGRISPSAVSGCMRKAAFLFLGVKKRSKPDPDRESIFDDGNWRHHRWQSTFLDMEKVLGRDRFRVLSIEEPIQIPKWYIAGTLDSALWIAEFGKTVVDIKGANEFAWSYIVDNNEPRIEHAGQLTAYLRGRKIPKGILMYEAKNSQLRKMCLVEWDRATWMDVEGWCEDVIEYLENEKLPPMHPDCSHGNYLFERCPFASVCYGGKSQSAIRNYVYRDFRGVEEEWNATKNIGIK